MIYKKYLLLLLLKGKGQVNSGRFPFFMCHVRHISAANHAYSFKQSRVVFFSCCRNIEIMEILFEL
jgi:hypothetical protein